MPRDIELAILFADVVGSTRLFELLGDLRARDMIATCIEIMRSATEKNNGSVIKTMGDEVMSTFPSASDALNAACQMQKQITAHSQLKTEGHSVAIRVGCHFGPVVLESRDVFGSTVHTANRMTSQAKAGQIVTTAATVAQLSPDWRAVVRQIDVATIKGQGSEVALYEVMWQPDDATSMLPQIPIEGRKVARLRLQFQDRELVVDEGRPNVVMGRAEENDVVIKGNLISRLHARVEISRNKIMLVDQSTNGTFIQANGGEESFLRRDSMQIKGEGLIGLGRTPELGSPQTIRYRCEEG
ncbi:MAG: adenylate/guanylate cyclase domain-containing protein [Steroidobacteraceae bacterium]